MKLLIPSDIHGNWPALGAVLRAEGSWDAVAFCGDVVDYGPHPVECLRWVAEHADYCVRGNHDHATDYVLIGHTHIQGMRTFGAVTVVNPGSVGLAHDVPGEACYAVCDGGRMRLKRVPYEVSRTVADLRRGPIPRRVIEGLAAFLNPADRDEANARRHGGCQAADQSAGPTTTRTVDSPRDGGDGGSDVTQDRRDRPEDVPGLKSTRPSDR